MSDIDLDAIEARANAATPGPWHVVEFDAFGRWGIQPDGGGSTSNGPTAAFVANARTDIPALIARVREQEQEIAELRNAKRRVSEYVAAEWNKHNERLVAELDELREQLGEARKELAKITPPKWPTADEIVQAAREGQRFGGKP